MKYWDSSALIPLLIAEESSQRMDALLRQDPAIATWWGSAVECVSALARLEREGFLAPEDMRAALERLRQASQSWVEVPATDDVREQAIRLLRVHRLRAADALQLAAAVVAADFQAAAVEFVTLDSRQSEAAEREGFAVP
ncbi:MAG: type II toxin-antitoxin system VapC family toxin [Gemmatimonadaceae bacterium]